MPDTWDGVKARAQGPPSLPSSRTGPDASRLVVPTRPKRRGQSRTVMILGFIAIAAVTAAAASIAWNLTTPSGPQPAPSASLAQSIAPAPPAPPPAPPPKSSASAAPSAAKKAPPPIPKDARQCFATLLPKNAFGPYKTKLDKACTKPQAFDAMMVVKTAIVRAGGSYQITPAMQEWSNMGWFESAAFAAMRSHCCPDAAALKAPSRLEGCKMEEALAYIANAIDSDKEMKVATKKFYDAAKCIARRGGAGAWGRFDAPYGGEEKYFMKVYDRMKKARGR